MNQKILMGLTFKVKYLAPSYQGSLRGMAGPGFFLTIWLEKKKT
jgi:hypothetical protein